MLPVFFIIIVDFVHYYDSFSFVSRYQLDSLILFQFIQNFILARNLWDSLLAYIHWRNKSLT